MNDAHLHLVVNHLPIVGILIGTLILIAGLILKNNDVKLTALGVFVFSAIASIIAFYTGEGAEEIVEQISGTSETLIHTHEEYAESFYTLTLILGSVALIGFIAQVKIFKYARYFIYLTLLLALADVALAKYVGTSGGEIRHSEIRSTSKMIPLEMDDDWKTGTNDLTQNLNVSVFPNPVNDQLNINLDDTEAIAEISIYNELGQKVVGLTNVKSSFTTIPVANLNTGVYFIRLISENDKFQIRKFIKNWNL